MVTARHYGHGVVLSLDATYHDTSPSVKTVYPYSVLTSFSTDRFDDMKVSHSRLNLMLHSPIPGYIDVSTDVADKQTYHVCVRWWIHPFPKAEIDPDFAADLRERRIRKLHAGQRTGHSSTTADTDADAKKAAQARLVRAMD